MFVSSLDLDVEIQLMEPFEDIVVYEKEFDRVLSLVFENKKVCIIFGSQTVAVYEYVSHESDNFKP